MRCNPWSLMSRAALVIAGLLVVTVTLSAREYRYTGQKSKTIGLPGIFAGLADPTDDSLYMADPLGLGDMFSFTAILDTGASGSMLSQTIAGALMLDIPTTGETYEDVGIGGIEVFDVSVPTRLLMSPVSVGELGSETISNYSPFGEFKFQIRQSDPVVAGFPLAINVVGTPVLNQHVMHVRPNSELTYTSLIPMLDYVETDLLPSMPGDLPASRLLRIPLEYQSFVEPGAPVSVADNPMISDVRVVDSRRSPDDQSAPSDWLFDTGGSLSIVGEDLAAAIGIDVDNDIPVDTVDVIGVGGDQRMFFGYEVDELVIPMTDGDALIFEDVVLFVPEAGALPADLPGIFGMNLLNQSYSEVGLLGPVDLIASQFSDWYVDPFGSQLLLVPVLRGDINIDGQVNGLDVDPFIERLLNETYQVEADMNHDGWVNGLDVAPFVNAILTGSSMRMVPEPSTCILVVAAVFTVAGVPFRRRG